MKIGLGCNPEKYAGVIHKTPIPCIDDSTKSVIEKLRSKLGEEELILNKADKDNMIVITEE